MGAVVFAKPTSQYMHISAGGNLNFAMLKTLQKFLNLQNTMYMNNIQRAYNFDKQFPPNPF